MAIDRRRPNKTPEYLEETSVHVGKWIGTYIGIVRRTVDTQKMGRLLVFVPQISNKDDQENWISVSYAPPFYGSTNPQYSTNKLEVSPQNKFGQTKHSYGMWFVPPDPGVRVLLTFINGDLNKGFWFACIPDSHSHHMVPSLGATGASTYKVDEIDQAIPSTSRPNQVPVVEYSESTENDINPNWASIEKPLHKTQFSILENQGLEFDYLRGAIKSGSQRQTPSTTFGISTPGRPSPDTFNLENDPAAESKLRGNSVTDEQVTPKYRKGGHTFVMDDGDIFGENNFFRIKTGSGHQVLLHDTGKFIYITNSTGTSWIELNEKGDIEIFADGNFSLRSAQSINLHADKNINMYAGNGIFVAAEGEIKTDSKILACKTTGEIQLTANTELLLKSGTALNIDAGSGGSMKSGGSLGLEGNPIYLNSGGTQSVTALPGIKRKSYPNSVKVGPNYKTIQNRISSTVDRVPIHEPDPAHHKVSLNRTGITSLSASVVNRELGRVPAINQGTGNYGKVGGTDQTKSPATTGKSSKSLKPYLARQPDPEVPIKGLTADETKVYLAGVGKRESGGDYSIREAKNGNYLGKYQMGAAALADNGYIKPEYVKMYGTKAVRYPEAWTGKDGVHSDEEFLAAPAVQERAIVSYTNKNYDALKSSGGIQPGDDAGTVAGMLQASHLLGPGGSKNGGSGAWRVRWGDGGGTDANNTSGKSYFDLGRQSIASLTKDGNLV